MFIKYFTNPTFDKEGFCDLLKYKCNVRCKPTEGGIILDLDAFKALRVAHMPHWVYLNRDYINSPLHTRPATASEEEELRFCWKYQLWEVNPHRTTTLEASNGLLDLSKQGKAYRESLYRDRPNVLLVVVDMATGEVVWEG